MNKTWLTSVSALALCTAFAAPAMADCVVQDNGNVINVVCEAVDADGVAVDNDDPNVTVDVDVLNGATVENQDVNVAEGDAIQIDSQGDVFFDSEPDSTLTAADDGIDISTENADITINNASTINAVDKGIGAFVGGIGDITVTNSGTITVGNNGIDAFGEISNIVVTNSGTINAEGDGIDAVADFNGDITITNSGTINSEVFGISADVNNGDIVVTNSGTINAEQDGVDADVNGNGDITVSNSGKIFAEDDGIVTQGGQNNVVTHSGFILAGENAFDFVDNTGNTLNLLAPAFIGGVINLGEGTAVNITTGASNSVLWDFSTGVLEGGAPVVDGPGQFFFNEATQQFATIDPTGFAASFDSLGDLTGQLSDLGRKGGTGRLGSASGAYGYKDGDDLAGPASGLWASAFGGLFNHQGDDITLDRKIQQAGLAVGLRGSYEPGLDLGAMIGYANDRSQADSRFVDDAHDTEADGFFAGVNARKSWGGLALDLGVTGGVMSHEQDRIINDNLADLGTVVASTEFDSRFISPEIGLSMNIDMGGGLTITPGGRLRYSAQWLDGYAEDGAGDANTVVEDRMLAMIEATAEIAATQKFDFGSITGTVGVINRSSVGDEAVGVTLLGQSQDIAFGAAEDLAGFAGLGVSLQTNDAWKLDVDGKAIFGEEVEAVQGTARITHRF